MKRARLSDVVKLAAVIGSSSSPGRSLRNLMQGATGGSAHGLGSTTTCLPPPSVAKVWLLAVAPAAAAPALSMAPGKRLSSRAPASAAASAALCNSVFRVIKRPRSRVSAPTPIRTGAIKAI